MPGFLVSRLLHVLSLPSALPAQMASLGYHRLQEAFLELFLSSHHSTCVSLTSPGSVGVPCLLVCLPTRLSQAGTGLPIFQWFSSVQDSVQHIVGAH